MKLQFRYTSPKIVFIGTYSDPGAPGGNNLLWKQAESVSQLGYDIEIITWPRSNFWNGKYPDTIQNLFHGVPLLEYDYSGLTYHVINPPENWGNDVSAESAWMKSVEWAKKLLIKIKPDIVHQHFWKKMWFFMEASIQLGIPTIYTVYDWGLPCRRQFLVRGDGDLCHLNPSIEECSLCFSRAENHRTVSANQKLKQLEISHEIELLITRWTKISKNLVALVVTSPFAKQFYNSQGIHKAIIHEKPWFYSQQIEKKSYQKDLVQENSIRLGFLGRIVPEKGLSILFQALEKFTDSSQIVLEIAGQINNEYAKKLKSDYAYQIGQHKIRWLGWVSNEHLESFFQRIDVLVVPSVWFDNSPTVLVEALAHNCPVICTDVPSMTHIIHHNQNGLVFELKNSCDLVNQIKRFINDNGLKRDLKKNASTSISLKEYSDFLFSIYSKIIGQNNENIYSPS